jgi:predicted Zn-dependent protease
MGPSESEAVAGLFQRAQAEYLKGSWYEAEAVLEQLLRIRADDAEARLMLATLLRHTRRIDEAGQQLRILERLDAAGPWMVEIRRERLMLEVLSQDSSAASPEVSPGELRGSDDIPTRSIRAS